ncbi:hypothetical protein HPP92_022961 [Vanilla planifolia]|uniref:Uncharacterized protein n=1 Tax=Vanilla planifolia TaxID=51239 RepID=A0A835UFX0_VANPL|nr:hypothetical protein HPP92_022961 [Vanilla planifolia]
MLGKEVIMVLGSGSGQVDLIMRALGSKARLAMRAEPWALSQRLGGIWHELECCGAQMCGFGTSNRVQGSDGDVGTGDM